MDRIWIVTSRELDQVPEEERAAAELATQNGGTPAPPEDTEEEESPEEVAKETKKKLHGLLRNQRKAAWDLFRLLAIQCVTPTAKSESHSTAVDGKQFSYFSFFMSYQLIVTEKGKEKEGKVEEEKLFPAQKDLINECLTILLAQLAKPVSADKGLFAVI